MAEWSTLLCLVFGRRDRSVALLFTLGMLTWQGLGSGLPAGSLGTMCCALCWKKPFSSECHAHKTGGLVRTEQHLAAWIAQCTSMQRKTLDPLPNADQDVDWGGAKSHCTFNLNSGSATTECVSKVRSHLVLNFFCETSFLESLQQPGALSPC